MNRLRGFFCILALSAIPVVATANVPTKTVERTMSFDGAKNYLIDIYRQNPTTLYCGCAVVFNRDLPGGNPRTTGGQIDYDTCALQPSRYGERSQRLEWEHILPASTYGSERACWSDGGRSNCERSDDTEYRHFYSDPNLLTLSVGSVNAVRSNYSLGYVADANDVDMKTGCDFKWSRTQRIAEPTNAIKGQIARAKLYGLVMYNYPLNQDDIDLYVSWSNNYPPSDWEVTKAKAIQRDLGLGNQFVLMYGQPVESIVNSFVHLIYN